MYIDPYVYIHVYIHVYIQAHLSGRSRALQGAEDFRGRGRGLNVLVEVEYFLGAAMGSPKSDFPRQPPGSTHLPPAQSGSDCAQVDEVF